MTDEYIRKQDVIDDLHTQLMYRMGSDDMKRRLDDWVKTLHSADVAPVVHAHWYILEYESLTCSRCSGFYYTGCDSTTEAKERLKEGIYPKYCPNCGAKMDGERKE